MADVQVERGHIRLANKLYRAAMLAKLSPVEVRALMECLWRQYGWCKSGDAPASFRLGGSGLAQSIGGSRSTSSQAITTLVDAGIIAPTGEVDDRGRRSFLVNKDYERWTCGFHRNPSRVHWTPKVGEVSPFQDASVPKPERTRPESGTHPAPEVQPPKASSRALEPRRAKENHSSSSAGASAPVPTGDASEKIHALVQRLGALTPRPISWPKWAGIVEQPEAEVEQLITWALGQQRPADAFLNCFAMDGTIKARKPAKTAPRRGRRAPYIQQKDDPRYFKPGEPMQTAESLAYIEKLRAKQQEEGQ